MFPVFLFTVSNLIFPKAHLNTLPQDNGQKPKNVLNAPFHDVQNTNSPEKQACFKIFSLPKCFGNLQCMRPRKYDLKQGRKVSLTVQLHCGGFLTDSDRSAQNFWLKLPLYRKHPLSHFLAQSKSFPVGVQQKRSLMHFALPPTAALLIGISSYGASLCG